MADGRAPNPAISERSASWTELFRCFQVALDPRKLLVAAVGILVMSFFWWLLSVMFWYKAPTRDNPEFSNQALNQEYKDKKKPDGTNYTEADLTAEGDKRFATEIEQWRVLDSLAGPGGRLRTMPWYEYRGPNPFLFATDVLSGTAEDRSKAIGNFITGSVPVLIEPLVKMLIPVAKVISPGVSNSTRFYLFLILMVNVAVWAFCAGIITRIAAVQLANKGPISLKQAFRFVCKRYTAYLGAPLVPLIIIFGCVVGLMVYGLVGLIPVVGDLLLYGLGLPVIIIGGAVMSVFLVGLVGYPLMYTTLSAEGDQSDTFDALSRSINYVYQSPWHYLWYWLVAIFYGAAVTLFILFFCSLTVYVGKWAVGLTASMVWTDRKPEYLFIYAPESFGWKELLTKDSPYAVTGEWAKVEGTERKVYTYHAVNKEANEQAHKEFYKYNYWGAYIVCFWLTLMFLMMLGFSYSFFWTAATVIYFLMRKKVDEAELDEVFVEEDEPVAPLAPPKIAEGTGAPPAPMTSLPVITPPAQVSVPPVPVPPPPLPPIPVVDVSPPPPPPATLPFSPPAVEAPKAIEEPKKDEPPKGDAPIG